VNKFTEKYIPETAREDDIRVSRVTIG